MIKSVLFPVRITKGGTYAPLDCIAAHGWFLGRMWVDGKPGTGARDLDASRSRMGRDCEGHGQVHVLLRSRCLNLSARHAGGHGIGADPQRRDKDDFRTGILSGIWPDQGRCEYVS